MSRGALDFFNSKFDDLLIRGPAIKSAVYTQFAQPSTIQHVLDRGVTVIELAF